MFTSILSRPGQRVPPCPRKQSAGIRFPAATRSENALEYFFIRRRAIDTAVTGETLDGTAHWRGSDLPGFKLHRTRLTHGEIPERIECSPCYYP
jgi:hypothetical protein